MADLSLCPKCGEPLSDDYGDTPDSLCFACRKPTGKLCDLLIAIGSSGDSPERLEAWRSIRPRLRESFDYPAAGWEERFQDCLHVAHGIDWETALGMPLPEIIGLLEAGPTPTPPKALEQPADDTRKRTPRGVSLRDAAACILRDDPESKADYIKSWNNCRKRPDPIGTCPDNRQSNLYEPSALIDFLEEFIGTGTAKEFGLRAYFSRVARKPILPPAPSAPSAK